ncbi:MAG: AmmeMemoRadiSam system protein B [Thermoplasmata archaeon]|nr:AmmeMemoRadiSam system protein B [Thermoplasmata archaeon]
MTEPRRPAVAGAFYPADGAALAKAVEASFLDRRGPGELPTRHRSRDRSLRAIVVPHAGYVYSGPIAARAYARVAADAPARSILVLGVDHHGLGPAAALSERPWTTPLGVVPGDPELSGALRTGPVTVDESAHRREHSIEVQLPFLQYTEPSPRVVPLQVRYGSFDELMGVAAAVRAAVADRDVLLVASTDFSHYIPPETARRLDALAIAEIERRDARGLYETVRDHAISMCGIAPTCVLLGALAGETLTARSLGWGHSGEAEPMADVVGYAAVVLERDGAGRAATLPSTYGSSPPFAR